MYVGVGEGAQARKGTETHFLSLIHTQTNIYKVAQQVLYLNIGILFELYILYIYIFSFI